MTAPTVSALVEELRASMHDMDENDEGFETVSDIQRETGAGRTLVKTRVRAWLAEGRMETKRVLRTDVAGRKQWVPAYRMKP